MICKGKANKRLKINYIPYLCTLNIDIWKQSLKIHKPQNQSG